jgi:CRISPR-associated endonuclease/helicase Cas3
MMEYNSHPDKKLEVHIEGVREKALKRVFSPLVHWAALFHDLGKINPNFQKKLEPSSRGQYLGYDEHAYLSAWAWLCFLEKNLRDERIRNELSGDVLNLQIVLALIAKHHGNLPDFDRLLRTEPLKRLKKFIRKESKLPLSAFLSENLGCPHDTFELIEKPEFFERLLRFTDKSETKWQRASLDYFFNTQFGFASLIEGDKRDAGDKYIDNYYHIEAVQAKNQADLAASLSAKWTELASKTEKSPLDLLRTAIREEAVSNLRLMLPVGQRIYTLTAPTGAGKTFSLLALAAEIQKTRPKDGLSILYALPFLSITEQVEEISRKLFTDPFDVLTASSKSRNERFEELVEKLDENPDTKDFKELLQLDFIAQTFDHPFIVTTFVQFFETLVSNRNSTLMKLPNFSKRIILIDEVQALPPRLYIFFAAWLDAFCRRFDSYVVLSTATMPQMSIPIKPHLDDVKKPELLFKNYLANLPKELLDASKYFNEKPFNRYKIFKIEPFELDTEALASEILKVDKPCLVIMNTIRDSKALYQLLSKKVKCSLLNTHFIPTDRKKKIEEAKALLAQNERFVLISTQLIEAGVDIDFPVVFRDLCPLPSLIQSAGRCNRNNRLDFGEVYFFHLILENGKSGATAIYREEARSFIDFSIRHIKNGTEERGLFEVQKQFFDSIANDLTIGQYRIGGDDLNMIELVNKAKFETLGKFKLINERDFGFEFQYFIRKNHSDTTYEEAVELLKQILEAKGFQEKRICKIKLGQKLKEVMERTVTIRVFDKDIVPNFSNEEEYFDIRVLNDLTLYTYQNGFIYNSSQNAMV